MKQFESRKVDKDLWLCEVTRFVFGDIPERIYIRNIPL